jgi:hypothetical protein
MAQSITTQADTATDAKQGALTGGALTDEVLDSSAVLRGNAWPVSEVGPTWIPRR